MTLEILELSQDVINELTGLAYTKWSIEFDALKRVKAETDNGSDGKEFAAFHAARMESQTKREAEAKELLGAIQPYYKSFLETLA